MKIRIAIHKDPTSVYGVTIPAIPGCFSYGDTINEAIDNTKEAIRFHLEGDLHDTLALCSLEDDWAYWQTLPEYQNVIWMLIEID